MISFRALRGVVTTRRHHRSRQTWSSHDQLAKRVDGATCSYPPIDYPGAAVAGWFW
jgi:hypothetical protein